MWRPTIRNAFGVGWNKRQYSRIGLAANPSLCYGIPLGYTPEAKTGGFVVYPRDCMPALPRNQPPEWQ